MATEPAPEVSDSNSEHIRFPANSDVKQVGSSNPPSRTSTPATLVDEPASSPPGQSEEVPYGFETGRFEKANTTDILLPPSSLRHSSLLLPESARNSTGKRVRFAEPPTASMNPNDGTSEPTSPESISSRQINEDFDLSDRGSKYKATRFSEIQRKLDNTKSAILRQSSSSSIMGQPNEDPQRKASISSNSSKSIRQRIDATFGNGSDPSAPPAETDQAASSATAIPNTRVEDLPGDRSALEGLINIHLSKLDRYKRQVNDFNTVIEGLQEELKELEVSREAQVVPQLITAQMMEIEDTRAGRDTKRPYVEFHRGELKVMAEKRVLLDEASGIPPSLPQVYQGLDSDEVWDQRFW
jgi:hypothetical protein